MARKGNVAASLVVYGKTANGWKYGSLVMLRNGRIKEGVLTIKGIEYPVAPYSYNVRTCAGSKVQYTNVGSNLELAQATLQRTLHSRQYEAAREGLGFLEAPKVAEKVNLSTLAGEYLAAKKSASMDLTKASIHVYESTLTTFLNVCNKTYADEVVNADVLAFVDELRRQGFSKKTCTMRYNCLRGFLRNAGVLVDKVIDKSTHKRLAAKTETNTNPYTTTELDKFFAVCDPYHRMVFELLLNTGLRFKEGAHLLWTNVDFSKNIIHVPAEQSVMKRYQSRRTGTLDAHKIEFKTKSRRSRTVPLFPTLKASLLAWREQYPNTTYVVGTQRGDLPSNHWLEKGKEFWKLAGLNCGICDSCAKHGECERFYLHKFRHTFGHRCCDAQVPVYKLKDWMGHRDLATTAIYLSGGSRDTEIDPFAKAA